MAFFVIRRLFALIPLFIGLTLVVFAISHLLPGDPVRLAAGPEATAADIERLTREFGMDKPLPVQYWRYVTSLLGGDWGQSVLTRRPVWDDLRIYLPATVELCLAAMILAIVVGIPTGLLAAVTSNRWPDGVIRVLSLAAISTPRFSLGFLLQFVFVLWLGLFPLTGRYPIIEEPPPFVTGFLTVDALLAYNGAQFMTALSHLALPALAMSLSPLATIVRMMRASTLEVLRQDYVMTERALGLSRSRILFKYVLKNAVPPTLTVIGLYVGWMLGGTVLVETVFDWPGIGLYATKAIISQDFMPVMGVTLVIGIAFVLANLVVDILYAILNPQVRVT